MFAEYVGASFIPLPKFSYTTPTPETERNTPDFQRLTFPGSGKKESEGSNSANGGCSDPNKSESVSAMAKVGKRKKGVLRIKDYDPIPSEVIIQIPSDDEVEPFEQSALVKPFETQSKLESDVWMSIVIISF